MLFISSIKNYFITLTGFRTPMLSLLSSYLRVSARVTFLCSEKSNQKRRPEQALHQKNNAHIEVGSHVLPARVNLKQHPCYFTPIWTPFFCGLERGKAKKRILRIGFFIRPLCVLEMNRFRWVYRQGCL